MNALTRVVHSGGATDLELALQHAVEGEATELVVLGARGGRLDHELANLLLLGRPEWAGVRIRLLDGPEEACVIRRQCSVQGQIGDPVSIIPMTPKVTVISTSGLERPLQNATITLGSTLGVSNRLTKPTATIEVIDGVLLVVHSRLQHAPPASDE